MAMAAFTTQALSFESSNNNNNHLRDASFSSYLNSSEETVMRKLRESNHQDVTTPITKQEDDEIGVFGAEKYFNGGIDSEQETPRVITNKQQNSRRLISYKKDEDVEHLNPVVMTRPKVHGPPSVRSESSWNSQSILLNTLKKTPPRLVKNKKLINGKSFLFGACKCSCSDKNSVDIEDHQVGEISFSRASTTMKSTSNPDLNNSFPLNKANSDSWLRDTSQEKSWYISDI